MRGRGEIINGYSLLQDWQQTGQAKISFCRKNHGEFFIKRFDYPTYPENRAMFNEETIRQKIAECNAFERHHNDIKRKLEEIANETSNLVLPIEIFREKAFWYKTYERVAGMMSLEKIAGIPIEEKIKIFETAANCLHLLHNKGIIHGDIKHDNIMVIRKEGKYVARIIDFDSSYFEGSVPDNPVGDFVYWSPELACYNQDTEKKNSNLRKSITRRSDIFALGLVFCRYLTGKLPDPQNDEGIYPWQMVLEKKATLSVPDEEGRIGDLIDSMLIEDYNKRPTAFQVKSALSRLKVGLSPSPRSKCCDNPKPVKKTMVLMGKRKESYMCENCKNPIKISSGEEPRPERSPPPFPPPSDGFSHCGMYMQKRSMVSFGKKKKWYQCLKCGHRLDME